MLFRPLVLGIALVVVGAGSPVWAAAQPAGAAPTATAPVTPTTSAMPTAATGHAAPTTAPTTAHAAPPEAPTAHAAPTEAPTAATPTTSGPTTDPIQPDSAARWIDVSVATLWTAPGRARAVDAPATTRPADPRAWLNAMTLSQRRGLTGRLETQALYGEEVRVLAESGTWSRIAVIGQSTPRLAAGYPGWVPTAQLTDRAPAAAPRTATVTRRTTRLFADAALTRPVIRVSYGTDLPVVRVTRTSVEVLALDGRHLHAARRAVRVTSTGSVRRATGAGLVAEARRFLGLPYLWAGTSGFGFDCSGFTYAVHAQLGVSIPRDAGAQHRVGRPVTRAKLKPGDLVFFANRSGIHHVGMYVGRGRMIHAPRTGAKVRIESIRTRYWTREYAGARRYPS